MRIANHWNEIDTKSYGRDGAVFSGTTVSTFTSPRHPGIRRVVRFNHFKGNSQQYFMVDGAEGHASYSLKDAIAHQNLLKAWRA